MALRLALGLVCLATLLAPPRARGLPDTPPRGTIRVHVHQHPDRVAAMDDLLVVGTDAAGNPVFRTEAELADSPPTLACALYTREQRRWYATRAAGVLAADRLFMAPSYTDRAGGVCEFENVPRGEYAGVFVIERTIPDRDLFMTYSEPRFDVIPDALVPLLPASLLRWMAGVPWLSETLSLLQIAPVEDWAATRPLGAQVETPVNLDVTPPRPRYEGARFKFDPRRGDLVMHVVLRRLEVTAPVREMGAGQTTGYVTRGRPATDRL